MILEALRVHEGTTSAELASLSGFDRYVVARRLPDLEKNNKVRKGDAKSCPVTGKKAMTWYVQDDK